jgi:hypothetical protein
MRHRTFSIGRSLACGLLNAGVVLAILTPGLALAQEDSPALTDTGFSITEDAVGTFFDQHGGTATFGAPISREFVLMGAPVQLFQNAALQVQPDGSVQVMQATGPDLVPYSQLNGLNVPAADPAMAFVVPSVDQPNYPARLQVFLQGSVPDTWNGAPVAFLSTLMAAGGPGVWGLPTSSPKADPNNPDFIYQRFQNGILLYDSAAATTQPLPMGEYLKALLTGQNLSPDLAGQAANSPLLRQYDPTRPRSLATLGKLTTSDLTDAFVPDDGSIGQ